MSRDVWDFLLPMLEDRIKKGEASYGTRLRTHNGRDALWDVWEELADALVYLTQELMEREDARNRELRPRSQEPVGDDL